MHQSSDPSLGRRMSGGEYHLEKFALVHGLRKDLAKLCSCKGACAGKKHMSWLNRHFRTIVFTFLLMGFLFLLDSFLFSAFDSKIIQKISDPINSTDIKESRTTYDNEETPVIMYNRLLNMASEALTENNVIQGSSTLWEESYPQASMWKPCADRTSTKRKTYDSTGFILVSANGGLNQQRVAVCNAVAVASLLNATLVIPKFLYSNVWNDPSQFADIYQEDHFVNMLKDEIKIVKELPPHLKSLDFETIGSQVTDAELPKEALPDEYIKTILPILIQNGVIHLLGFGNRLGFDPFPFELQRLRCKCNFHALKFVPKIQQTGSLLIKRIRKYDIAKNTLDKQLLGKFISNVPMEGNIDRRSQFKYLALHLRFEVDMVAYSQCEFGDREKERRELQAYREVHFPLLTERLKNSKLISPVELRKMGRCPLTPEEAALVLAGLGFPRGTYIYLAGSHIYGGISRMHPLLNLYPKIVTKEDLLLPSELEPFKNFSSQLAALDFMACATADVFAMTDSGSQLSSLVSGYRTYYGGGRAPSLRPSKKRLALILEKNNTIEWRSFEEKIKKMIKESQRVRTRGFGRSIYRHPRCSE